MENIYDVLYGKDGDTSGAAMNLTEMVMHDTSTAEELKLFGDWCIIVCEGK